METTNHQQQQDLCPIKKGRIFTQAIDQNYKVLDDSKDYEEEYVFSKDLYINLDFIDLHDDYPADADTNESTDHESAKNSKESKTSMPLIDDGLCPFETTSSTPEVIKLKDVLLDYTMERMSSEIKFIKNGVLSLFLAQRFNYLGRLLHYQNFNYAS
jgi:hypothetical protein